MLVDVQHLPEPNNLEPEVTLQLPGFYQVTFRHPSGVSFLRVDVGDVFDTELEAWEAGYEALGRPLPGDGLLTPMSDTKSATALLREFPWLHEAYPPMAVDTEELSYTVVHRATLDALRRDFAENDYRRAA